MKVGAPLFAFFAKGGHDAARSADFDSAENLTLQAASYPPLGAAPAEISFRAVTKPDAPPMALHGACPERSRRVRFDAAGIMRFCRGGCSETETEAAPQHAT
jgi:hypothetical protein